MADTLKLYVKVWCPWCVMAQDWLKAHGYAFELLDVEKSRSIYQEMIRLSGQQLTPTLAVGDKVLPDFGLEELDVFLKEHSIHP